MRVLLLSLVFGVTVPVCAQDAPLVQKGRWNLTFSGDYERGREEGDNTVYSTVRLQSNIGYFVTNGLQLGLHTDIISFGAEDPNYTSAAAVVTFGLGAAYYIPIGTKMFVFPEVVAFGRGIASEFKYEGEETEKAESSGNRLTLGGGFLYRVGPNAALLGRVGVGDWNIEDKEEEDPTYYLRLTNARIGFSIFF